MTKADYFKRAVEELDLDTRDPFTLLFANACALLDQRDELKRDRARLVGALRITARQAEAYRGQNDNARALLRELGEE